MRTIFLFFIFFLFSSFIKANSIGTDFADVVTSEDMKAYCRLLLNISEAKKEVITDLDASKKWADQILPRIKAIALLRKEIHDNENIKHGLAFGLKLHPENQGAIDVLTKINADLSEQIAKLEQDFDSETRHPVAQDPFHAKLEEIIKSDSTLTLADGSSRYVLDSVFYRHATQLGGAIFTDTVENSILLVFVGTDSMADWALNFAGINRKRSYCGIEWHSGFYDMWSDSLGSLSFRLEKLLVSKKPNRIICTGHSTGGGLAMMMGFYLKKKIKQEVHGATLSENARKAISNVQVMTFASPPQVDDASAAKLESILGKRNILRVVFAEDIVVGLRNPLPGFKHVGLQITLDYHEPLSRLRLHFLASYFLAFSHGSFGDFFEIVGRKESLVNR